VRPIPPYTESAINKAPDSCTQ